MATMFKKLNEALENAATAKSLSISIKTSEIPYEISGLPYLEELYIKGDKIDHIPDWIKELGKLKKISIKSKALTVMNQCLFIHPSLEHLDFKGCSIKKVEMSLAENYKITVVNLSENQLEEIPSSLYQLKAMQALFVAGNKLTKLPDEMIYMEDLRKLILDNNQFIKIPEVLNYLPITHLSFDENPLPDFEKEKLRDLFNIWSF